jgi:aminopeptidase N
MINTLLGADGFRQGMDLYFERHDGQAVTTEEFVSAMEDANKADLSQFRRWYKQSGTPEITVDEDYDAASGKYTLTLQQSTPATPGQDTKQPFHIPVKISLMNDSADTIPLNVNGDQHAATVLDLTEDKQQYVFEQVTEKPILSILQGYSAPVKLHFDREDEELAFCMAHEADDFNRWEAGQQLSSRLILSLVDSINAGEDLELPEYYVAACRKTLNDVSLDKALVARALTLPSLTYVGEMMPVVDVDAIHQAREFIYSSLASELNQDFQQAYDTNAQKVYDLSPDSMGERFLRNQALAYLMYTGDVAEQLAFKQYQSADNMTDQMAAFRALVHHRAIEADNVVGSFYQQWQKDNLVIDKWFTVQATIPHSSAMQRVEDLFEHDDFDIKNPNRVRSLLGAFCAANPLCFHDVSGFGYELLSRYIEKIDAMNPQIASRLCVPLTRWRRYSKQRQSLMKKELQRLISLPKLSKDVSELVEKSLK